MEAAVPAGGPQLLHAAGTEGNDATQHLMSQGDKDEPRLAPQRWLMLLLYCLTSITIGVLFISFVPITSSASEYYQVSDTAINSLAVAFMAMYAPFAFLSSWFMDVRGLRTSLVTGCALFTVSGWVRWLGRFPTGYPLLVTGQLLAAASQPFIIGAPAKLAGNWFPSSEQGVATSIATLSNSVGIAIGFLLAPAVRAGGDGIPQLLLYTALIATSAAVPVLVLFRTHPDAGLSDVQSPQASGSSTTLREFAADLRQLLRSRAYLVVMASFSMALGIYNVVATLLHGLLSPFSYPDPMIGTVGTTMVLAGIAGAAVAGPTADRHAGRVHRLLAGVYATSLVILVIFAATLGRDRSPLVYLLFAVLGAAMTSSIPLGFLVAMRITPAGYGTTASLMMMAAQVLSVALVYAASAFTTPHAVAVFIACLAAVPLVLVAVFRQDFAPRQ